MRGCASCERIYAPRWTAAHCWECGGEPAFMELVDALALARRRQDRLRQARRGRPATEEPVRGGGDFST